MPKEPFKPSPKLRHTRAQTPKLPRGRTQEPDEQRSLHSPYLGTLRLKHILLEHMHEPLATMNHHIHDLLVFVRIALGSAVGSAVQISVLWPCV